LQYSIYACPWSDKLCYLACNITGFDDVFSIGPIQSDFRWQLTATEGFYVCDFAIFNSLDVMKSMTLLWLSQIGLAADVRCLIQRAWYPLLWVVLLAERTVMKESFGCESDAVSVFQVGMAVMLRF
jgi:hypothetical protein